MKDQEPPSQDTTDDLDALLEDVGMPPEPDVVSTFPIQQDRAFLLSLAPPDRPRVRVRDADGVVVWRDISALAPTDVIILDRRGQPRFGKKMGRRKKKRSSKPPTPEELAALEEKRQIRNKIRRKSRFVSNSPLVKSALSNPDALEALQHVMVAFSEEAAAAEFEKTMAEEQGKDGGKYSSQRVRFLRYFSETWLQHKELRQNANETEQGIDLESPSFSAIFLFILETFRDVLMGMRGLDSRTVQLILTKFSKEVQSEEWKQKAKKRIQQAIEA